MSIDLPPISISLSTKYDGKDIDTAELSSLFSDYLLDYLHMELPARYETHDVSLVTNYFMENGTMHECFVTGHLSVVDRADIDRDEFNQVLSLTLLSLFSENSFLQVVHSADDKVLRSTTELELALLKGVEKQNSVSALLQENVVSEGTGNDNMYFFIACAGFGVAVLLLGYSIYFSRKRKRARQSRGRKRNGYRTRRNHSPDSNGSPESYYDEKCGIPVMDFVVEACSSFLSNDDRSYDNDSVRTRDIQHNNCSFGSFWEPEPSRPKGYKARSSSMPPQRARPYPYPATETVDKRGHVRRSSQPSDMSLAMKSQTSAREEWTCVDGVVTRKAQR